MNTKKLSDHWDALAMIPVMVEMTDDWLIATRKLRHQLRSNITNTEIIEQALTHYHELDTTTTMCWQQCQHWQKTELNDRQRTWISEIETHLDELKQLNHDVLEVINMRQQNTFDAHFEI